MLAEERQAKLLRWRLQALHEQGMALAEARERVQQLTRDMHKILGERPARQAYLM